MDKKPYGIEGLLYIPFFFLCLVPGRLLMEFLIQFNLNITGLSLLGDRTPLTFELSEQFKSLYRLFYEAPQFSQELFYFDLFFSIMLPIGLLILLDMKSRLFPKIIIFWLFIDILQYVFIFNLYTLMFEADIFAEGETMFQLLFFIFKLVSNAFWIVYFIISKRVKNTFTY